VSEILFWIFRGRNGNMKAVFVEEQEWSIGCSVTLPSIIFPLK
jgi:hypothetical protein